MNKNFTAYLGNMILIFALIAFLPSELSMIVGAAVFAIAAMGMPFGLLFAVAAVCSLIFAFLTVDFHIGILMALSFIIPGWIEGILIRKRCSLSTLISVTAVTRSGLLLAYYNQMAFLENLSIKELLFGDFSKDFMNEIKLAGYPEEFANMAEGMLEMMKEMLPSVIFISGLSFAFLSIACIKFMSRRTPFVFDGIRKLSDIKMDVSFTICAIIISIMAFYKSEMQFMFINCFYVIYVIYVAAGFAFLYRLIKKGLGRPVVSFIITAIIGFVSFGFILPIMGIIGSFVKSDFDKNIPENKTDNDTDENRKEDEI